MHATTVTRPTSWPTDRSIMPPAITNAWPIEKIANVADCWNMLTMLEPVRNCGTRRTPMTTKASSAHQMRGSPWYNEAMAKGRICVYPDK